MTTDKKPKFELGRTMATNGAIDAIPNSIECLVLLSLHASGDWGCVDPEDAATNDAAVIYGNRILSAYPIDPDKPCAGFGANCVWIITEADRSSATFLLPSEY